MERRLPRRRINTVVWFGLLIAGCTGAIQWMKHVPDVDDATAEQMLADADRMWEQKTRGHEGEARWFARLHDAEMPPSFQRLKPHSVTLTQEGVEITMGGFFVESWGYFVLPSASTYEPRRDGDPSYRLLRGRVYRFHVAG